jgi:hypothetical protein
MALRSRLPGIANATELRIELVFSHAPSRAVHRALRDVPPTQIFKMASKTSLKSHTEFARERHGGFRGVDKQAVFPRADAEMTSPLYPDLQKTARRLPHASYCAPGSAHRMNDMTSRISTPNTVDHLPYRASPAQPRWRRQDCETQTAHGCDCGSCTSATVAVTATGRVGGGGRRKTRRALAPALARGRSEAQSCGLQIRA